MQIVTDTDSLEKRVSAFEKAPYLTVDTEFMRDTSYWPRLCLIQIADPDSACIIDPLAEGIDLAPFYRLMTDSPVLKVFHACRQDIEIVFHATGKLPTPVFDTQVAAMVCGFGDSAGYDTLVQKITGRAVDKSSRFTDWARRPLSDQQLEYAIGDVTHLREIYARLSEMLAANGRESWVREEMALLTNPETYRLEPETAWKRIKTRNIKPRPLARLQAVAAWREREAQDKDVPRNRIARDETLLEIASQPPGDPSGLSAIRGLSGGFHKSAAGQRLWDALQAAEALDDDALPRIAKSGGRPAPTPPMADLLKVLLKIRTQESDVAARLVASSADVEAIARGETDVPALTGWRKQVFGNDALALMRGDLALGATPGGKIEIIELEPDKEQA